MAASRFKNQSIYKNAFGQAPKREFWLQDILAPNDFNSLGRGIAASISHMTFCWESPGTIALYPLSTVGRLQPPYPLLHAHSANITDMEFSPFFEDILATAGEDKQIKLWRIGSGGSATLQSTLSCPSRIEAVSFNPLADNIIASCNSKQLNIYDVTTLQSLFSEDVSGDLIQSMSWEVEGRTLGIVGKDRVVRCVDPRAKEGSVVDVATYPVGKEFQIQCLPSEKLVVSSLNQSRDREISIWDLRACKKLNSMTFGVSNRTISMLFDTDTNLLFLGQRGEVFIHCLEFIDASPYLIPGTSYHGKTETKSICLIPKRAVDVMKCEIDRILQLTKRDVIPISISVTRKSYMDFHADLYPDTFGSDPGMTAEEWINGFNRRPKLTTLDPQKIARAAAKLESELNKPDTEPVPEPIEEVIPVKPVKVIPGIRNTPFKHLEGKLAHKNTFIFGIPTLCKSIPIDGHMIQVALSPPSLSLDSNKEVLTGIAAVPLQGAGGQIALIPIQNSGRLLNAVTLENTSNISDIVWDRFDPSRLIVASEDCRVRIWNVTPDNMESGEFSHTRFEKHKDRISSLTFHPLASSLIASADYYPQLLIWDLISCEVKITLNSSAAPIISLSWSPDGCQLAVFNKDSIVCVYSPLQGPDPVWQATGPSSGKAGRVIWLSQTRILISGFEKTGTKVFHLFDTLKTGSDAILSVISITNVSSPSLLIPHFDSDTNLLFFTTRGESSVFVYEYLPSDHPYFFALSALSLPSQSQELYFFPKVACQVRDSEVVRGVRLTQSSLELFGFKVPRVRNEFFQDDLFPPTQPTWEPVLTAEEWLSGKKPELRTVSLQPDGMTPLSKAPAKTSTNKLAKSTFQDYRSAADHEKELVDGMIQRMQVLEHKPLKQDLMEGVDDDEWGDS
ncbi:Coronin-7 isoform X5 [Oopsacas minuta]|uniref:Coronin n=1 Tax=Oopsacas minuta TaxID=111878 RepID=A0AAV7JWK2_9METZ|nr:Coronin-7 isoform X5 [Oopsacas minuta]